MSDLDDVDIKILRLLQENGRYSYSDISKILNIPQSTVRFKVNKLRKERYIRKFMAILDPKKLGYPIVMIVLLRMNPKYLDDIFNYISKIPELHHMFQITGKYDTICIFHAKDMEEVGKINNSIRALDGVTDSETMLATGRLIIKNELPI